AGPELDVVAVGCVDDVVVAVGVDCVVVSGGVDDLGGLGAVDGDAVAGRRVVDDRVEGQSDRSARAVVVLVGDRVAEGVDRGADHLELGQKSQLGQRRGSGRDVVDGAVGQRDQTGGVPRVHAGDRLGIAGQAGFDLCQDVRRQVVL